jgi:hypothetical protein
MIEHGGEEFRRDLAAEPPVAVLGEHGDVPHRIVDAEADEPAEQQIVVELLHQLPLGPHRIERLQQQRPQQLLRRDGAALSVKPDTVRQWRWLFGRDGLDGLRSRKAPGAAPVKAQAALAVANEVLSGAVSDRPNWTLARLADEIARRTGVRISTSRLSVILCIGLDLIGQVSDLGVRLRAL